MAVYKYDSQNQELKRIAGGTLYADCPIGSYIPFGGTAIPTGWLLCNGQAVSRTDYADLFAVIGTAYGSGDGSTTFNIPDLREAVPKGAGLTSKSNNHMDADGLAVGEFIDDRLQDHRHTDDWNNTEDIAFQGGTSHLANDDAGGYVDTSSARVGATTEVKSVGSNYIIKAKQIGVPADFASAIEDVIDEKFSYSTSEVNTGKKWIDGKPIYRKVLPNITFSTNVTKHVDVGASIDKGWVDLSKTVFHSTWFPSTRQLFSSSGMTDIFVNDNNSGADSNKVLFNTPFSDGSGFGGTTYIDIVVEYTKTTD